MTKIKHVCNECGGDIQIDGTMVWSIEDQKWEFYYIDEVRCNECGEISKDDIIEEEIK